VAYRAPSAIVVHTAGAGVVNRATKPEWAWWRAKWGVRDGDALQATAVVYSKISDACGHYVIGQDGKILQLVPESHSAWHVGGKGSRPYFTNEGRCLNDPRFDWWRFRWPSLRTPRELGGGFLWEPSVTVPPLDVKLRSRFAIGSCNANSLGVEVVPPIDDPQGPWSADAWLSLTRLVLDICDRHRIAIARETVISHSDAHPLERTTSRGKPWDPSPEQWSWETFRRFAAEIRGTQ
jgi:hypothetical protein